MEEAPSVLILGIGNLLWADEGFGVRALQALQRSYEFPDRVRLLDGGTQGIYLVQHVREARVLVVFDAVDYGLPGGTLKQVEGEAVPKFLGAKKISLHQTGFQEVLAMAEMLGDYPDHLLLIGVQPVELEDYGGSLGAVVRARIEPALHMALDYLSGFGIYAKSRETPLTRDPRNQDSLSDIDLYEAGRPPADLACRLGDPRILHSGDFVAVRRPAVPEGHSLSVGVDAHLDKYRRGER